MQIFFTFFQILHIGPDFRKPVKFCLIFKICTVQYIAQVTWFSNCANILHYFQTSISHRIYHIFANLCQILLQVLHYCYSILLVGWAGEVRAFDNFPSFTKLLKDNLFRDPFRMAQRQFFPFAICQLLASFCTNNNLSRCSS